MIDIFYGWTMSSINTAVYLFIYLFWVCCRCLMRNTFAIINLLSRCLDHRIRFQAS